MNKKIEWIALIIMVIDHYAYDWAIPFVHSDYHALFASSWNLTLFGYIGIRLIDDSIENSLAVTRKAKRIIAGYFMYRCFLNSVSFLQSFEIEGSWERYKIVTSNYYADGIIWVVITIILIITFKKEIYRQLKRYVKR